MKIETPEEYELSMAEVRRLARDLLDDAQSPRRDWSNLVSRAVAEYVLQDPANAPYFSPPTPAQVDERFHQFVASLDRVKEHVDELASLGVGPVELAAADRLMDPLRLATVEEFEVAAAADAADAALAAPVPAPNAGVHHLRYGVTTCGLAAAPDRPVRWSTDTQVVTCASCLEGERERR